MDKDVIYFSHDSNARHDPDIANMLSKWSWEGYGMYWAVVESMREDAKISLCLDNLDGVAYDMKIDKDKLIQFVTDCIETFHLFRKNGNRFWSDSLRRRVEKMHVRSEKAKASARVRWEDSQPELDLGSPGNKKVQVKNTEGGKKKGDADAMPTDKAGSANAMRTHKGRNVNALPTQCDGNAKKEIKKGNKENKGKKEERVEKTYLSWNEFAQQNGLAQASKLTEKRAIGIRARLAEQEFDLDKIYAEIRQSTFLRGENERRWKVDFDFIFCSQNNYLKILEGKYRGNNPKKRVGGYQFDSTKYPTLNKG